MRTFANVFDTIARIRVFRAFRDPRSRRKPMPMYYPAYQKSPLWKRRQANRIEAAIGVNLNQGREPQRRRARNGPDRAGKHRELVQPVIDITRQNIREHRRSGPRKSFLGIADAGNTAAYKRPSPSCHNFSVGQDSNDRTPSRSLRHDRTGRRRRVCVRHAGAGVHGAAALFVPISTTGSPAAARLTNERYSPLKLIDASNVGQLKGVWMTQLPGATAAKYSAEAQPLEYDGVIYIPIGTDDVFAVSVETGKVLCSSPSSSRSTISTKYAAVGQSRGVALGDGEFFIGQLDGKLVALDQATGNVTWSTQATRLESRDDAHLRALLRRQSGDCRQRGWRVQGRGTS